MTVYKCRFELTCDVDEAILMLSMKRISIKTIKKGNCPFNDDEWEFESSASLDELIDAIKKGCDTHILYGTLQLKENYTGERDYSRK
jgi:hypothetical protein